MINTFSWNRSNVGRAQIQPVTLAFGDGSTTIAYSYDGIYWNPCGNDVFYTRANHGCWNGYIWVAVGCGGNWAATSYDGITWTGQDYSIFNEGYYVAWNGTVFLAAGTGNDNTLAVSYDGFNWSAVSTTSSSSMFSICANYVEWTGNVWCAVGSGTYTTATCTDPAATTDWAATSSNYMVTDVSSIIWDLTNTAVSASSGTASDAFNRSEWRTSTASYNSDGTASSLYTTTIGGTTTIYGEYLTIAAPESKTLNYYLLQFNISGDLYEIPSEWYLLGSNTYPTTNWTTIDTFSFTKTTPPTYGSMGYYSLPIPLSTSAATAYQYYRIVFTKTFAKGSSSYMRVMGADLFYESATTTTVDRKIRPFVTPNGIMYPIRLGSYNYVVYADRNNSLLKTNTFGLSYYNSDISGLNLYSNSGFTRGFAFDGQNCLAIGSGKMSYTSDFGKTWSDINPSLANTDLYSVAYNGTYFVMGGNQYVSVFTNGNSISYISPAVATSLYSAPVDSSSIYLTWSADDDLSVQIIYNICGGTYSTTTDRALYYGNTILSSEITGLSANTKYYFKITPISYYGEYGTAISDVNTVTLSSLSKFNLVSYYDTSAQISFDGSFSYIDISYGTSTIIRYYTQTSTTNTDISNIVPNTQYTIYSTTYNSNNVSSTGKTVSFLSYPKVTVTYTAVDTSSVLISNTNSAAQISAATIAYNSTGVFSDTDVSYSYSANFYLSALSTNTTYYFRVVPYGSTGLIGTTKYINATTAATETKYTILVYDTSAQISFDGSMTYIDISYADSVTRATTLRYYSFPGTTSLDISNLQPDTSYNFYSAIYNRGGDRFAGQTLFSYTLPKITQIVATSSINSADYPTTASITLTYTGGFSSLNLWWNTTGSGIFSSTDASASGITGNTYTISGLSKDTIYYIRSLPIGKQGLYGYVRDISINTTFDISGLVVVGTLYGERPGSYYMYLTSFTAAAVDISSIYVNWGGLYDNVTLQYDTSSGFVSPTTYKYFNITNTTIYGLSYNTTYYLRATPIALGTGTAGNTITTTVTTNSIITTFTATMYDTSAVIFYDGSFSYIDISCVTGSNIAAIPTKRYSTGAPSTTGTDISNLIPDTSYIFQSAIFGRIGTQFAGKTITAYTLPKASYVYATETAFTEATLTWGGDKYTSMNLYWNTSGTGPAVGDSSAAQISGNTYTISGLTTNTVYYFWAEPVGQQGGIGTKLTVYLNLYNVYFTTFDATSYDSSSIILTWSGYNDSVELTSDISTNFATSPVTQTYTSPPPNTIYYSGLGSPNTTYYFKATPYTTGGLQGNAAITSATTAATLTTYITYVYDTSAQIVYDGSLSYVDISYILGATGEQVGDTIRTTSAPPVNLTISDLAPDTSYILQLSYYNRAGDVRQSGAVSVYTLPKITYFAATETAFTETALTWGGGNYTSMNLYWNTTEDLSGAQSVSQIGGNTYTATGLTSDTIYYFWAVPVGEQGGLGSQIEISMNLYSVYLTSFSVAAIDSSSIAVSWAGSYDTLQITIDSSASTTAATRTFGASETANLEWDLAANATYYFTATPFTYSGAVGTSTTSQSTTAATLTTYITYVYDTSAQIVYDGSLSYVDISYSLGATGEQVGSTQRVTTLPPANINLTDLVPDTSYIFQLAYYNSVNVRQQATFITVYTLPKITYFAATETSFTEAALTWDGGNYTSMNLYWNTTRDLSGAQSISQIGGNTYSATGLTTDTIYYFWAVPVGEQGGLGTALEASMNLYSVYLTSFSAAAIDSSSILVSWTGSYDILQITIDSSAADTTTATRTFVAGETANLEWDLAANTTYYFTATPFTTSGLQGNNAITSSTTEATLTTYITYVYDTSAQIVYDGSLSYIDISYSLGATGEQIGSTQRITTSPPANINLTDLVPDTSYIFQLAYYNIANVSQQSTIIVYTLPKITYFAATETGLTEATLTWDGGNYTSMNLYWNSAQDLSGAQYTAQIGGNTYTATGLTPDTIYYFWAVPVGEQGGLGTILEASMNLYSVYLTSFSAAAIDSSSILVSWAGSYDILQITIDSSASVATTRTFDAGETSNLEWALASNATYYFTATPFTTSGAEGTSATAQATTAATLTKYITYLYDTSAQIVYDGSLSYVDISYSLGATGEQVGTILNITSIPPNSITIENLLPDTSYIFQLVYYNTANVGQQATSITVYTLPKIIYFSASETAFTEAELTWDGGNYTSMNLYWNTTHDLSGAQSAVQISGNTYNATGLTTDSTYYFWAVPVGEQGGLGSQIEISMNLYSVYLTSFSAAAIDSSAIAVSWTGSYDTLEITIDSSAAATPETRTFGASKTANLEWDLAANATYYFTSTPFTTNGIQGTSATAHATTAATLTKYITYVYDTSAQIMYDGSLSYVDISYSLGATGEQVGSTMRYYNSKSIDISNLTPDTSYIFQLAYYNSANMGQSANTIYVYTSSNLSFFVVTSIYT